MLGSYGLNNKPNSSYHHYIPRLIFGLVCFLIRLMPRLFLETCVQVTTPTRGHVASELSAAETLRSVRKLCA